MLEKIETVSILLLSVVFFISGKVRSDIVALCALVALIVCGVLTPAEALAGFSSPVLIMMIGLFVVGGAIFQTGLAKMISSKLMKFAGNSETRLFLLVMLVTSLMGAFVSNTGTVAIMIPIVVSMAMSMKMSPGRLLMPLAFASSMSGMMTLIGTPPNLVINDELVEHADKLKELGLAGEYADGFGFFTFLPVGIICIAVGTVILLPLSKRFLSKPGALSGASASSGKSLKALVKEYGIANNLHRLNVGASSLVVGKSIGELDIREKYGVNIIEVRMAENNQRGLLSKSVVQKTADPDTIISADDMLYVSGTTGQVKSFADAYRLDIVSYDDSERKAALDFYDIGVAEIVLMPSSTIVNKTVKEVEFRTRYNVSVLGVCRKNKYILEGIADEKIHSGDVLLVQGTWSNIAGLEQETNEWIVVGRPLDEAAKVTLDYKAPVAAAIMLAMIAVMVFDFIPIEPVTAVMIAGLLMVLTGCFRNVEAAYKTINWESVVLIGAMMPMSTALENTGISAGISNSLATYLGGFSPLLLLAGIYFTTSLLTMFISNTATAVLMAPIAMNCAMAIGVNPVPMLFAVTLGASLCFASPFSTPPNALVMPAGQYTFSDYVKVGLPLQVILGIVMILLLPLLFPF